MNRDEKTSVIDEIKSKMLNANFAIISDYRGLRVSELQDLRRSLRLHEAELKVVKNTFLARAIKETKYSSLSRYLEGTTITILSYGDPVNPAQIVSKFADDFAAFIIKGGVLQGKEITLDGIRSLAKLPSREILLSQMLQLMNSSAVSFVSLINAVPRNFMNVLLAINDNKNRIDV